MGAIDVQPVTKYARFAIGNVFIRRQVGVKCLQSREPPFFSFL